MLRIVVAKPGLDGHDRGAKVVARALRDAGHEVIYTGLHQTPEQIVETAIQEDADAVGLSVLSGAHMTLFRKLIELLEERDAGDIVVFGGGIVPEEDVAPLEKLGVAKIFTPGATTGEITGWVAEHFDESDADSGKPVLLEGQLPDHREAEACCPSPVRTSPPPAGAACCRRTPRRWRRSPPGCGDPSRSGARCRAGARSPACWCQAPASARSAGS